MRPGLIVEAWIPLGYLRDIYCTLSGENGKHVIMRSGPVEICDIFMNVDSLD